MLTDETATAPNRLLSSVIEFTEIRDRDALATSLARTLVGLTRAKAVTLYRRVVDHAHHPLLLRVARASACAAGHSRPADAAETVPEVLRPEHHPPFRDCLEHHLPVHEVDGRHLYPILDGHDKACGVLEIEGGPPSDAEQQLINGFLQIYRNYLAILDDSERDTLTGLLNRKTFDRNITRILARQLPHAPDIPPVPDRRHGGAPEISHWLAVMDVDHFKRINDRFGHLYGDEVLLLLARLMQEAFRHHDHLFRFGGEEFVILLDPTDPGSAHKVLDRFRKSVECFAFPQVGQVTVSIGFAAIALHQPTSAIIGNADEALYYAKGHGRNQVCGYEQLVEAGRLQPQTYSGDAELF